MNTEETVLYMKDNLGAMREWAISYGEDGIIIRHGQVGGSMQYQRESINEGKASRSLEEQIDSRINSRINKQLDKGYVYNRNLAESRSRAVNAMGLPKPMLAHKLRDVKNINYEGAITQPKFDGNRCLIYCDDGVNRAYSRNGKTIIAIKHILDDLQLEDGQILDGELYCHGYPLQTIVSWIKREQENTLKIKYHLYDIVAPHLSYKERSDIIRTLVLGKSISPVYGDSIASHEDLLTRFIEYRNQGYEGAILRWGNTGYEDGKRSKSLIKVKHWEDAEFVIIKLHESSDGWAILECETKDGHIFRVSAPGSIKEKTEVWENEEKYIGKIVTIEYANLTKDGIPFHPIAINFRDKIQ